MSAALGRAAAGATRVLCLVYAMKPALLYQSLLLTPEPALLPVLSSLGRRERPDSLLSRSSFGVGDVPQQ